MVTFVAHQLGILTAAFVNHSLRSQTRKSVWLSCRNVSTYEVLGLATVLLFAGQRREPLFSKESNRDDQRFQLAKRDVGGAWLRFRCTVAALKQAEVTGEDDVTVVDREIGMMRLDEALPISCSVAGVVDQNIRVTLMAQAA